MENFAKWLWLMAIFHKPLVCEGLWKIVKPWKKMSFKGLEKWSRSFFSGCRYIEILRPVYFKSIVMSSYMKSVIHSFQISKLSVVLLTEPTNNKTHQIIENTRIGQREIKMQKQIWIFQVWSISKRGPLQFISLFYDLKAKLTAFFSSLYQA